ncbi:MDR family oxidoreductase [Gorillibacterium sp. sgz5001074]|uniref:MDR family oxidoreductase n=1 Tax=Gorillibacterium sp. sgz5001074 TaxID=3446695 RepID=UPI003F672D35
MGVPELFQGLVVRKEEDGALTARMEQVKREELPPYDVTVKVQYSGLNYKDGLAVTGRGKIIRQFPFVPGVDFAGTVMESANPAYRPGDSVILTGWGVGERSWGGYAEYASVKSEWLVPLPDGLDAESAMGIGTAGLTAMLSVMELERHADRRSELPILVTGAAGGVGSMAVALLAAEGYPVTAVTGRPETAEYLRSLGATAILDRSELLQPAKPLDTQLWQGAVDTVGGPILAHVLSHTAYDGTVAACGLAGGSDLPATVFPFILRGVRLIGVDSVMAPYAKRVEAWTRLAGLLPRLHLGEVAVTKPLSEAKVACEAIMEGKVRGRIVFRVQDGR